MNSELKKSFSEARAFITQHERFLISSHEYTDGDDLGAILALARVLKKEGKQVYLLAKGGVPDNLLFLPGQAEVYAGMPENTDEYDALITIGCGEISRTGFEELFDFEKPILNIDHHKDTKPFGRVNVWDPSKAANCELLYLMFKEWKEEIDKSMAMNLLTGIFTDTGGFRHSNVSALTLEVAADLLRRGAKLDVISRFTFSSRELPQLRAWSIALSNAKFDPDRQVVYTVITEEDIAEAGATEEDLDGVVELLNTIPDAKFSMLLKQRGDEIKGSLRSEPGKGVDVSEIARAFGGGGHKLAAGFKFKGKIEKTSEGWKIS